MERRTCTILAFLFCLASCTWLPTPVPPAALVAKVPVVTRVADIKLVLPRTGTPTALPTGEPSVRPSTTTVVPATSIAPPTVVRTRTPRPGQLVWEGDLHIHTTCSDGQNTYEEMVEKALALHLDFIAITDHVGTAERNCHNVSLNQCRAETRLLCLPGAEMTARLHLLAIGIEQRIDPKLSLEVWVKEIHRQGGLAIAAHPYDKRWKYTEEELVHSDLDAMECARGTAEQNQAQLLLSGQYHIPCVYNSDAHYQKDVGWRHNVCSVPINSLADLKAALIGKKCKMN